MLHNPANPQLEDEQTPLHLLHLLDHLKNLVGENEGNTRVHTEITIQYGRTAGEDIEYGEPIRIDESNIESLGLGRNGEGIVTYHMDSEGHMTCSERSDFTEGNDTGFLYHMDSDVSKWRTGPDGSQVLEQTNSEPPAMTIQAVKVDGVIQGYFVTGIDEGSEGMPNPCGLYLDATAVDVANLPEAMKENLFTFNAPGAEQAQEMELAQNATPDQQEPPLGLENELEMGAPGIQPLGLMR